MTQPRKVIAYVLPHADVSGGTQSFLEICQRLDRSRYQPMAISLEEHGPHAVAFEKHQMPLFTLQVPPREGWKRNLPPLFSLIRGMTLFRKMKPHIVHTLGEAAWLARPAARMAGVPWIIESWKAPPSELRGAAGFLRQMTTSLPDLVVCSASAIADDLKSRTRVHPERIRIIPPGVDLNRVDHPGKGEPDDLGEGSPRIGVIARLSERKGIDTLLEAARILKRYHEGLRLVILGSGPQGFPLLYEARRQEMEPWVTFAGDRKHVGEILRSFDVAVFPSRSDGCPLGLLEALAAGVPCVTCDLPAIAETLKADEHCLMVRPDQPAILADAVDRLLVDEELRTRLSKAGREHVREHHRAGPMVAAHQALYDAMD